jgi:hypothetical protein
VTQHDDVTCNGRPLEHGVRGAATCGHARPPGQPVLAVAVACLTGIAVTHFVDLPDKLSEAPYMAALFVALIVVSLALAGLLVAGRLTGLSIRLGALLAAAALAGYGLSRSVGLPQIEDHVGHWLDPAGVAAACCEITLIGLAIPALRASALRLASAVTVPMAAFIALAAASGQTFGPYDAIHDHAHNPHLLQHRQPVPQILGPCRQVRAGSATHAYGAHGHHPVAPVLPATALAQARGLLDASLQSARRRFPTLVAARRAGFRYGLRSQHAQRLAARHRRNYLYHLTNYRYLRDGRILDPERPETLVYLAPRGGAQRLVAFAYRAPANTSPPTGGLLAWHVHSAQRSSNDCRTGATAMVHVWLTRRVKAAFGHAMPTEPLGTDQASALRATRMHADRARRRS